LSITNSHRAQAARDNITVGRITISDQIAREIAPWKSLRDLPRTIRVDQGCQFTSKELDLWAYSNRVTLDFSRPGKPTDNAYAKSFNARVRLECLGQHWFMDLDDACKKVEDWRNAYNEVRPHSGIGDRTPMSLIRQRSEKSEASNGPEILA
jgi:putative transposase